MYCPNCGKANPSGQKFCRSCGLSLEAMSQALAGEVAVAQSDDKVEITGCRLTGWQNPLLYAFLLIVFGLLMAVFGRTILVEEIISDIGTIIALLGVGLLGFKGVLLILAPPKHLPQSKGLFNGQPTSRLPERLQPGQPQSISEHTTRTLEPLYSVRKAE